MTRDARVVSTTSLLMVRSPLISTTRVIVGTCIRTGTYPNHPEQLRTQYPTDLPELPYPSYPRE